MGTTEAVQGQVLHPPLLSLPIWHIQSYCGAVCGDERQNKLQDETCRAARAPQHTQHTDITQAAKTGISLASFEGENGKPKFVKTKTYKHKDRKKIMEKGIEGTTGSVNER